MPLRSGGQGLRFVTLLPNTMRLQVLVIDDIAESRHALCALVTELGHQAVGADSGLAGLEQVRRQAPDLVLVDLLMPGLDGFEVTRRIRELCAERWLPVIVTSSLQGDEHFTHALEQGADDYLARPVNAALLEAKLRHYGRVLGLQAHLSHLAQRERDILDNILDAVVTLDEAGGLQEMNRAARAMFGAAARGAGCAAQLGADLEQLLARPECRLRRADGTEFDAEVSLSEWRDAGRIRYTLVLRDLTERHQMERMKDEFLATVSHELRTPLTSVIGALSLLAGGAAGALPPAARPLADVARRNGERLSRLIDDILDLTKLEGDRMVLHLRPQAPVPLLREALAANRGYADRAGVRLAAEGLDEAAATEVRLDADRFLQIMANLLSNAIKHTPAGELVRLSFAASPGGVRITVRDRGPGIDPRFRARMFEKFTQADGGDRRAQGGTGLGLYITRMLVDRMGGRIGADEVPEGSGASFTVEFPADRPAAELPPVLLVERDFETRERVARWLAPSCAVHGVPDLAHVQAAGEPPRMLIGNPQGQGSADEFCTGLARLAAGRPVLLYGDSVDAEYAGRAGLRWLSPSQGGAEALVDAVREALAPRRVQEKQT